jgi:hypothetical protein
MNFNWESRNKRSNSDWSNQEKAEFYRVAEIMKQAGLHVETDFGLSDEGSPWFVFVRASTSDVLAHFALIDGLFVAISSLTDRIYKGRDVRSVVNQMLETHPTMLPRSDNNSTLMLHPGVSLTALVAAAFVFSVDKLGTENFEDVVKAVLGPESQTETNGATTIKGEFHRIEGGISSGRPIFSDVSPAAYQTALLGAVLLAKDVFSDDGGAETITSTDRMAADTVLKFENNTVLREFPENAGVRSESANNTDPDKNLKSDEIVQKDQTQENGSFKLAEKEKNSVQSVNSGEELLVAHKGNMIVREAPLPMDATPTVAKIDNSLERLQYIDTEINTAAEMVKLTVHSQASAEPKFDNSQNEADKFFDMSSFYQQAELGADLEALGITLDLDGASAFFSITEPDKIDAVSSSSLFLLSGFSDLTSNVASVTSNSKMPGLKSEDLISVVDPLDVQDSTLTAIPIIGHHLSANPLETTKLSNAIDVVFFEGGNMVVEGFELGADVVWFFVPKEKVTATRGQITDNGDFLLDFGDQGSLTLVGVVSEQPDIFLI